MKSHKNGNEPVEDAGTAEARESAGGLVLLPAPLAQSGWFLKPEVSPDLLVRAASANHISWFRETAFAAGGEVHRTKRVLWTYAHRGCNIGFPHVNRGPAAEALDHMLAYYREKCPNVIGMWATTVSRPKELAAMALARGFRWGWQPHWMGLDLHKLIAPRALPKKYKITVEDKCDWEIEDLPYYDKQDQPLYAAYSQMQPRRTWHLVVRKSGMVIGHAVVHGTTELLGVAGIYNVGVVPAERGKGVGRAISAAACQFARALGYNYALLNAATHIYEKLGFVSLGYGQTWWMDAADLKADPPKYVEFVEAIGTGDYWGLEDMSKDKIPPDLNAVLPCKMKPMGVAAKLKQPQSAEWLLNNGADLEVMPAWELGWVSRIRVMAAKTPEIINQPYGDWNVTPLHDAVAMSDVDLIKLLLECGADRAATDSQYKATPLQWAQHFKRENIAELLRSG